MMTGPTTRRQRGARKEQLRVLVADDNVDAAQTLGLLLELEGHRVVVEHTGEAALETFFSFAPDVAVLDIRMPDLSGYEIARRIRASKAGRETLLVAISAWDAQDDKTEAAEAGFDCHLGKPSDPELIRRLAGYERTVCN